MAAKIIILRQVLSYGAIARKLHEGVTVIREVVRCGLQSGSISIDQANELRHITEAMQLATPLLRQPRVARATQQKRAKGRQTRERVLKLAEGMKAKQPRLSKSEAARRIAKQPPSPCGLEQAKKYIDEKWDRAAWGRLSSIDR